MGADVQFDLYRNPSGRTILDPQVAVPLREAWLYRNVEALAAVQRGLAEADEGSSERERLSGAIEVDETLVAGVEHGGKCGRGTSKSVVVIATSLMPPARTSSPL